MNPNIKIQIPKPCTQLWEEMAPEAGGRHCTACAKTVTDFTRMTDAQILEALRNNDGGCGRFRKDQLERELIALSASRRFSFATFYKVAASLLLVFSAGKIAAQERKEILTEKTPLKIPQDTSSYISGFVTDEKGEPLTGAKIEVNNYVLKSIAGIDGEFEMKIPDSVFERGGIFISVSFPGYEGHSMFFRGEQLPLYLNVTLTQNQTDAVNKGGFQLIQKSERKVLTIEELLKMCAPEGEFVVGTIALPPSQQNIRAKERELQYKQRENRSEEFIQDYGR